ncbi:hypothetical protein PthBH41_13670 [Parageobacillus thermoglucosidasius]|nr:hypothetical protein PthBH41_13670 [Parageobacillus thermoglucosidasius]
MSEAVLCLRLQAGSGEFDSLLWEHAIPSNALRLRLQVNAKKLDSSTQDSKEVSTR